MKIGIGEKVRFINERGESQQGTVLGKHQPDKNKQSTLIIVDNQEQFHKIPISMVKA